ncbi:FAD:protein FMN transferase [Novipirellula herctigrandis]
MSLRMTPFRFCFAWLCLVATLSHADAPTDKGTIQELRGQTMGTTYMVKVFDPPSFDVDVATAIDAELRSVNDQMSTYLKSSELSLFNASGSTDWFPVSPETAQVVLAAIKVSKATDGAFDVTVGPLVNAWSFGPDPKTNVVPSDEAIATLRESVGYENLSARVDPPALKKSTPTLKVDLSSIAKGHGVDRVVKRLTELGAKNVFVEIGGEVRTTGSKAGKPWKVGIENPVAAEDATNQSPVAVAHPLVDSAMATSGDYRIFFEVDGKRYSHTIDPRTGRPIEHDLASVSVVADTCMMADAWATAINVLGSEAGLKAANKQNLHVFIIRRTPEGIKREGTGAFASYATDNEIINSNPRYQETAEVQSWLQRLLPTLIVTVVGFGVILVAMAIGVMLGGRSISGSCGGIGGKQNPDGTTSCSLCGTPSEACKELRAKMEQEESTHNSENQP